MAGTVAAVIFVAGSPQPRHAIAIVDVSESMKLLEEPVQKHLRRLQQQGILPGIVRATGSGLSAGGSPSNLLGSLKNALQSNPAIDSVYLYSDFDCTTPDFDYNDQQGELQFENIIRDHHIRLFIVQLPDKSPPGAKLVSLARDRSNTERGDWVDTDGKSLSGESQPVYVDKLQVSGTVSDAVTGSSIADANVSMDGFPPVQSGKDGAFNLVLNHVQAGNRKIHASGPGLSTVLPIVVQPCQAPVSLQVQVPPSLKPGERLITLAWKKTKETEPDDLDMHVSGPQSLEIFYQNRGDVEREPHIHLDVDNVRLPGHPPRETIHIGAGIAGGPYELDICDFNGEIPSQHGIPQSEATVRVFDSTGLVFEKMATKPGRDWTVLSFDARGGQFTLAPIDKPGDGQRLRNCFGEKQAN